MEREIWKDIKGYEGRYQVSNYGRVKSLKRKRWNGHAHYNIKNKILKATFRDIKRYYSIGLSKDNKKTTYQVARLVARTFINNPQNKPEINHKDGNKQNNHINNLEWSTRKENMEHAGKNNLMPHGKNHSRGNAKLLEKDVKLIKIIGNYLLQKELAELFYVHPVTISHILNKRSWKHI